MTFERDPLAGKIPVTLITGFLGSGKTTLISRLVKHPDMNRVAVVINEIGEIGIDHDLVTLSSENITLLANGCICCSVRTDMQETLRGVSAKELDAQRIEVECVEPPGGQGEGYIVKVWPKNKRERGKHEVTYQEPITRVFDSEEKTLAYLKKVL